MDRRFRSVSQTQKFMATIGEQAIKGSKSPSGKKVAKKPDEKKKPTDARGGDQGSLF